MTKKLSQLLKHPDFIEELAARLREQQSPHPCTEYVSGSCAVHYQTLVRTENLSWERNLDIDLKAQHRAQKINCPQLLQLRPAMWTHHRSNLQWITSHHTQSIEVAGQQNQWKYTFVDLVGEWNLCSPRKAGISTFACVPNKDERSKYYTISCHEQFQMLLIWKCRGEKKPKILLIETKHSKWNADPKQEVLGCWP